MPTTLNSSRILSWRSLPLASLCTSIGSPTMSPTVCRGSSDAYGSWKIIAISRRKPRRCSPRMCVMSSPLNVTLPSVGSSSPITVRPRGDLPHPASPTRPTVSPALISRSTPSTAWTWPTVRWRIPDATGNHIFRSLTETSGSLVVHARLSGLTDVASGTLQLRARLRDPARGKLRLADPQQRRHVPRAALDLERAARVEGAAARQVDQVGRQPLDRLQRFVAVLVESRDRFQQRPGVGVFGIGEDVLRRA